MYYNAIFKSKFMHRLGHKNISSAHPFSLNGIEDKETCQECKVLRKLLKILSLNVLPTSSAKKIEKL